MIPYTSLFPMLRWLFALFIPQLLLDGYLTVLYSGAGGGFFIYPVF
jgi:hypothetical protein